MTAFKPVQTRHPRRPAAPDAPPTSCSTTWVVRDAAFVQCALEETSPPARQRRALDRAAAVTPLTALARVFARRVRAHGVRSPDPPASRRRFYISPPAVPRSTTAGDRVDDLRALFRLRVDRVDAVRTSSPIRTHRGRTGWSGGAVRRARERRTDCATNLETEWNWLRESDSAAPRSCRRWKAAWRHRAR